MHRRHIREADVLLPLKGNDWLLLAEPLPPPHATRQERRSWRRRRSSRCVAAAEMRGGRGGRVVGETRARGWGLGT